MNRRQLYAMGEPLGTCVTRREPGRMVYGGGGGGGSTQKTEVAPELKPLANLGTQLTMQASQQPFQFYGERFADLNQNQNTALDMIAGRAQNGSPVMDAANKTLINTLQGGQTNPYLDSLVSKAQNSAVDAYKRIQQPQQATAQAMSGSFGNSGLQEAQRFADNQLHQNLGDIATSMYGSAYETDRANQMSALGMAPTYGNQAYTDAAQLLNAGQLQQGQEQQQHDFDYQQFQDANNQLTKNAQLALSPFTGGLGMITTTKSSGGK